ncbi:hypothetical protein BJV78DRAFT_1221962, partial [Lactifluus subvellereus]
MFLPYSFLTFLRQLPFISSFLNLPYIQYVTIPHFYLSSSRAHPHYRHAPQFLDCLAGSRTSV